MIGKPYIVTANIDIFGSIVNGYVAEPIKREWLASADIWLALPILDPWRQRLPSAGAFIVVVALRARDFHAHFME